ncbi:MFS transporter [soil metagenome]
MSKTFRALGLPHFRWYTAAALITNTAMWMQRIDQDWLAVKLTHDGTAVGITTALQFLPTLLVGPLAGVLADRFPTRPLLVATCALMALPALLLGLFIATHTIDVWHIYGCALLLGVASSIDAPARMAYIREILSKEHLVNAIGLNQVNFHTSRIIGPALAGFLISAAGIAAAFFAVGTFFLAAAGMLFLIRQIDVEVLKAEEEGERALIAPGLAGAFWYLIRQPGLVIVIGLACAVSSFALNFQITLTLMATQIFKLQAAGFGGLTSMMAVGSISGALLTARLEKPSYVRVFACAALLGLTYLVATQAGSAVSFGLILVPIGMFSNMFLSTSSAVVQTRIDARLQGRVTGLYMAGSNALVPLGAVVIGMTASAWTPRAPLAVAGLICVLGGAAAFLSLSALRLVVWKDGRVSDVDQLEPDLAERPIA